MLKRVDRVQIAVADSSCRREGRRGSLRRRTGASRQIGAASAKRSTMQAGAASSNCSNLMARARSGLRREMERRTLRRRILGRRPRRGRAPPRQRAACSFERSAGQLYLDSGATFGMRTVISQHHERRPSARSSGSTKSPMSSRDWRAAADRYARIFGLDASKFSPIESKEFGYTGTLTLFDPPARLDRIEIAQITDPEPCDGPLPSAPRRLALHVLRRDRRRRRARTAPASARLAIRAAYPRRGRPRRTVHPSVGISTAC